MKRNFLPLTATEFETIKAEISNCSLKYGSDFEGLSEDSAWQVRYNLRNKFDGTDSFASVCRFISKSSYSSYLKQVA